MKPIDIEETLNSLCDEIGEEYFAGLDIDDGFPCSKTNPLLWAILRAASVSNPNFNPSADVTEKEVICQIIENLALQRIALLMFEKGNSNVQ